MCSFGSCKTLFEFLSQFRKVRNAFECFVTQVQTRLPKAKRVWPMKMNVICTVFTRGGRKVRHLGQIPGRILETPNNVVCITPYTLIGIYYYIISIIKYVFRISKRLHVA